MSAAAAAPVAEAAAPAAPKSGKKKLIIIIAAVAVVLAGAGAGGLLYMKKRNADAAAAAAAAADEGTEAAAGDHPAKKETHSKDHKPPVFVPMDPFVVNLADHEADRYAQIGVTLEVPDAHVSDEIKTYLPAIRNNVLMLLAHKTSADLAGREGKELLAREIRAESLRAMGYEVEDEAAAAKKKAKAKPDDKEEHELPIRTVQFSSFIIQ